MLDNPETTKAQAKEICKKTCTSVKWLLSNVPPLHPAGWPFVGIFAAITLLMGLISEELLWVGLILTAWCAFFFRDPARVTPIKDHLVIAPADGIVSSILETELPSEFEEDDMGKLYTRVSIFLSVFDVHIQRIPIAGEIKEVVYRPGKFLNASLDKASVDNERSSTLIETTSGKKVAVVQIAGLIARRIINDLKKEQNVLTGQRYGLIRFGSRVDVYLPEGVKPQVCLGQRMIGGETLIADLTSTKEAVEGIIR